MSSSELAKASELDRYLSRDAKLLSSCASSAAVTKSAVSIEQTDRVGTANQSKLNFLHRMSDEAAKKYAMALIEFSNAEENKKKQFEKAAVYSYFIDLSIEEAYVTALNQQKSTQEKLEALEQQLENEKQRESGFIYALGHRPEGEKEKTPAEKELDYLREMDKLTERTKAELEASGALFKLSMERHSNVYNESVEKEAKAKLGPEATESDINAYIEQKKADLYDDLELINQAKKLSLEQGGQLSPENRPIPSAPPLDSLDHDDKETLLPENRPVPSAPPLENLGRDDQAGLEGGAQQYTKDGVPIARSVDDDNPNNIPVYTPDGKSLVEGAVDSVLDRLTSVVKQFMNSPIKGEEGWSEERDNELLGQHDILLNEHRENRGVEPMPQSTNDYLHAAMHEDRNKLHRDADIINRDREESQQVADKHTRGMDPNSAQAKNIREHQQKRAEVVYGDQSKNTGDLGRQEHNASPNPRRETSQEQKQEAQTSTSTTPANTKLTPSDVARQGTKLKEQQRKKESAEKKSSSDQSSSSPSSAPTPKP